MMDQELAIKEVDAYIAQVGELTRAVSQRYDEIFSNFHSILVETMEGAADMADAARIAMDMADAAADSIRNNFVGQPTFDCSKSCSACCHLFVAIPPGVAEAIARHVDATFTAEDRASLMERLDDAAAKAKASAAPHLLRSPCALLDTDGNCSVYSVRPLACRSFTSTSRVRCEQVVFGGSPTEGGVDQNPARYRIYEYATRALQDIARQRGLPSQQQGLAETLLAQLTG